MSDLFADRDALLTWLTGSGLRLVLIFAAAFIVTRIARRLIHAAVRPETVGGLEAATSEGEQLRRLRRESTVEGFLSRTTNTFIWLAALLTALTEVGINTGPLVASVGVVGLAVGFGAQTLVKDATAGIFLLVEGHYDVGDRVKLNNVVGEVVGISIRRTTLRGDDGAVHTIPNGAITLTSNLSREVVAATDG